MEHGLSKARDMLQLEHNKVEIVEKEQEFKGIPFFLLLGFNFLLHKQRMASPGICTQKASLESPSFEAAWRLSRTVESEFQRVFVSLLFVNMVQHGRWREGGMARHLPCCLRPATLQGPFFKPPQLLGALTPVCRSLVQAAFLLRGGWTQMASRMPASVCPRLKAVSFSLLIGVLSRKMQAAKQKHGDTSSSNCLKVCSRSGIST